MLLAQYTLQLLIAFIPVVRLKDSDECQNDRIQECEAPSGKRAGCHRSGQLYSVAGNLCKNAKPHGNCHPSTTITGINFGSEDSVTDTESIVYIGEDNFDREDKHEIFLAVKLPEDDLNTTNKEVYMTGMLADPTNCDQKTPFIQYSVPTEKLKEGNYEFGLRFAQAPDGETGYREFNVYFNEKLLVKDDDLIRLETMPFKTIDVYVNVNVESGKLFLSGHRPMPVIKSMGLQIYYGECGYQQGFILSAFHIVEHSADASAGKNVEKGSNKTQPVK